MEACLTFIGNEFWQTYQVTSEVYPECSEYFVSDTLPSTDPTVPTDPNSGTISGEIILTSGWSVEDVVNLSYVCMLILATAVGFKFIRKMIGF